MRADSGGEDGRGQTVGGEDGGGQTVGVKMVEGRQWG